VTVLNTRLKNDFPEAWYGKKHWSPAQQRKDCAAKLAKATAELESLA
jgi:hypothetical protein